VEQVGGTVVGAVLNNVDISSDATYGYYTSYYGYYSDDGKGDASMKPGRRKKKTPSRPVAPTHERKDEEVF
jgi:polysaccharide biosynthesis transport protein